MTELPKIPSEYDILQVGQVWKHYKGSYYEIVALPRLSSDDPFADGELFVTYRQADAPEARPWTQPADRFLGVFVRGNRTECRFRLEVEAVTLPEAIYCTWPDPPWRYERTGNPRCSAPGTKLYHPECVLAARLP